MKCFGAVIVAVTVASLVPMYCAAESHNDDTGEENIERTIEKVSVVMKSLLNRAGSEKRKLSGLVTSLESLDGALHNLEGDAYTLSQQNIEDMDKINDLIPTTNINQLEEIKECMSEIQGTLTNIEGLVHPCGGPGWVEVANVSYSDPNVPCPDAWQNRTRINSDTNTERRGCGTIDNTQDSIERQNFTLNGLEYYVVCGRVHGYAYSDLLGFRTSSDDIDSEYVTGVTITHGSSPSTTHIWTFAASSRELQTLQSSQQCPCEDGESPPLFVGQNYFCESGANDISLLDTRDTFHGDDLLWDGKDCVREVCCTRQTPPYFHSYLPSPTTNDLTVSLILSGDRDILITHIELYVQKHEP